MSTFLLMPWDKKFETGLDLIDSQHKELVGVINIYNVQCGATPNAKKALATLKEMKNLCEIHFKHEELIQASCQYPNLSTHKAAHNDLNLQIMRWTMTLEEPNVPLSSLLECHDFILTSILSHLSEYDMPFFEHYRSVNP